VIRHLLSLLLLFVPSAVFAADSKSGDQAAWKAGASSAVITPKSMMWMAGYAARTKPADGVAMDLYAKALVLDDGTSGPLAIITIDLVSIPREVRRDAAARIQKEHGIPPERLLINASHTHSGPELRELRTATTDNASLRAREANEYCDSLVDTFTKLVGESLAKRVPADVDYTHAKCAFAMNRRRPTEKGYQNAPWSEGPVDHRVPVLRVVAKDPKKEIAFVFGYACHCTVLGWQKFSGDYAGAAQAFIQEKHPGAVAMFMNGCSGDQNPYPRRDPGYVEIHGKTLATAVDSALDTPPKRLTGTIQAAYKEIPIRFERQPPREELEQRAKSTTDKLDAGLATRLLELLDHGEPLMKDYPYPIQVVRFGKELTLIALGGEVVVDYSIRLQREIEDPIVWVAGYSNDVMTYIPSRRVWDEGGYEAGDAMKWNHFPSRWAPELEEEIVKGVKEVRAGLK
jgi:neutral ceramidase